MCKLSKFNIVDSLAFILVLIGAINWGLVGLFSLDVVALIFGDMTLLSRIIYIVIGAAAVYLVVFTTKYGKCKASK